MHVPKVNFIVIDDSMIDCYIAKKVIQHSAVGNSCCTFQQAAQALEYIKKRERQDLLTIVFVDEQMPGMNGMDFVKAFEALSIPDKDHYYIYILSSSINGNNRTNIKSHMYVKQFISKPLLISKVRSLFKQDLKCVSI